MFSVALIGPDGAGKTTLCRKLASEFPEPMRYLYMGINLEASDVLLPTTRLLLEYKRLRGKRPDLSCSRTSGEPLPRSLRRRLSANCKSLVRMANLVGEEWYRQMLARHYMRRGEIVLFDRHFYLDYYAADIANRHRRPIGNRLHGRLLERAYPRPDLVILLDAPAEFLMQRKGESTLEYLEQKRTEYRWLGTLLPHFHVVDATQSVDEVRQQTAQIIIDFLASRRRSSNHVFGDLPHEAAYPQSD